MSLQVWIPFTDGTLKQQGLSDATVSSAGTINLTNAGKLGKCITFTSTAGGLTIPPSTMTSFTDACSVSFWFKINDWGTSYATYFQAGTGSTPWNNYIFGFLRYASNSTICFTISNGSSASNGSYLTSTMSLGVWYHVAITYETGKCKIYLNGELDHEYTTTIVPAFNKITKISVGRSNADSSYQTQCNMNDLRIYDHCLSPMEINELSKGLMLHYPLNRNGWGQENLLKDSNVAVSTSSYAMHNYYFESGKEPVEGKQYTIQLKGQLGEGKTYFGIYNSGGSVSCVSLTPSKQKNGVYTSTFNWRVGSAANTYLRVYHMPSGTTATSTIEWIKLEEGDIATPWCPNSSDNSATTIGLDSTIEYDCSGFENNGTRNNTFTWSSDTPKYSVSQNCTGTNYISLTSPSTEIKTISLWANWTTIPSGQSVLFVDNGSGIGLGLMSTGILCSTSGAGSSYTFSKSSLVANTWYHFVIVKTGTTTRKLYINGVEQTTTSNSSNWTYSVNELQLGKRSTTSDGFIGKLSDFRAYATELSEYDIKSLYQERGYIDNKGNVYGTLHEIG